MGFLVALLVAIAGPSLAEDAHYYVHPALNAPDPYEGLMQADGKTSCCGRQDCFPVPYDLHSGLMNLGGSWIDPIAVPGVAIYFSFDEGAHACLFQKRLVCVLIPGSSAQLLPME